MRRKQPDTRETARQVFRTFAGNLAGTLKRQQSAGERADREGQGR